MDRHGWQSQPRDDRANLEAIIFSATAGGDWLNLAALMPRKFPTVKREVVWPVVLAGTITWCSGFPAAVPGGVLDLDKVGHFAAYGALATAAVRIPALKLWPGLGAWWAILLAAGYGLGDEFRQSLTHGVRTYDMADWAADAAGAVVAVVLYIRWAWYRRLMETRLWRRRKPQVEISAEARPNPTT